MSGWIQAAMQQNTTTLLTLTKSQHFWTAKSPLLVNIVCERPLTEIILSVKENKSKK